ncbi:hypothetical protein [Halorussus sp. AFM4]|uniref:hypothetical protein n=1 Tax=Halorussus sp. AFM4 TaxID=3421651 RepID=UPI003EB6B8F0
MSTTNSGGRTTLESLQQPNEIPYLGIEAPDFWAVAGSAGVGITLTALLELGAFGVALTIFLTVAGGTLVYVTPSYLNVRQWIKTAAYYVKQPGEINNVSNATLEANDNIIRQYQLDKATRDTTHIKRFYPARDALERDDGQLVGAVKLEPPNMDFAEAEDWAQVTRTCADWVNKNLDFDVQVYVTTRSFPIGDYINSLIDRLRDPDVNDNPVLQALIQEQIETRPQQLADSGTELVHFYIIIPVDRAEVINPEGGDKTALEKLAEIPFLGILFAAFASYREDLTEQKRRARMFDKLNHRTQSIESNLVQEISGFDSRRVPVEEWIAMNEHFWEGIEPDFEDPENGLQVRQQPAVSRNPDGVVAE